MAAPWVEEPQMSWSESGMVQAPHVSWRASGERTSLNRTATVQQHVGQQEAALLAGSFVKALFPPIGPASHLALWLLSPAPSEQPQDHSRENALLSLSLCPPALPSSHFHCRLGVDVCGPCWMSAPGGLEFGFVQSSAPNTQNSALAHSRCLGTICSGLEESRESGLWARAPSRDKDRRGKATEPYAFSSPHELSSSRGVRG